MTRRSKKADRPVDLDPKEPIRFFLNFEPEPPRTTHQEKKFGGVAKDGTPIYYFPPDLANARSLLKAKLAKFAPPLPWKCPIQLTVEWTFLRPKSAKSVWMTRTPDTDNLQKMLKDVMTECGFWRDDALVVREVIEKVHRDGGQKHGVVISMIDLTQEHLQGENS